MVRLEDDSSTILEGLVDAHDLDGVIEALADVCFAKADHLRSNWQDDATARTWERAAKTLLKAASKL